MNALSLSALLLLVWRPSDLWDPGFQLSFAATAGIIYLAAPFTGFLHERRTPRWLAAAIAVSLAAQLPVTPVMLGHFNQLSIIGVAANLLVVPLAGPATMPQKKNPDVAELIRGKTGRLYGNAVAAMVTMKGLPLTYNSDMDCPIGTVKSRIFRAKERLRGHLKDYGEDKA